MSHRRAPEGGHAVAAWRRGTPAAIADGAMDIETTCRIPRSELLGLLNTMEPTENQRITAEMPAVEPPADEPPTVETPAVEPPAELVIRFKEATKLNYGRAVVIGASFVLSFAVGLLVVLL